MIIENRGNFIPWESHLRNSVGCDLERQEPINGKVVTYRGPIKRFSIRDHILWKRESVPQFIIECEWMAVYENDGWDLVLKPSFGDPDMEPEDATIAWSTHAPSTGIWIDQDNITRIDPPGGASKNAKYLIHSPGDNLKKPS